MLIAHGAGAVRGLHLGYITGPRAVPYSFSRAGLAEITVKIHAVMSGKKLGARLLAGLVRKAKPLGIRQQKS